MDVRKYPVYQYIKFIWQKKFYLIGFSILFIIAAVALSLSQKPVYTSTALVFTGNGENDFLSKPELIKSKYEKELSGGTLNVNIPEPFVITLSHSGEDKQVVKNELEEIAKQYTYDLTTRYNDLKRDHENYMNAIKSRVETTEEAISLYSQLIIEKGNEENLDRYIEVLLNKQETHATYLEIQFEINADINHFEPPKNEGVTTIATSNNLLRNIVLGGAFGFQLALVFLVFWKYIVDARKSNSSEVI